MEIAVSGNYTWISAPDVIGDPEATYQNWLMARRWLKQNFESFPIRFLILPLKERAKHSVNNLGIMPISYRPNARLTPRFANAPTNHCLAKNSAVVS
jgi:hypothetical protein